MSGKGKYKSLFEAKVVPMLLRMGGTYEQLELPYTSTHIYKPDVRFANGVLVELKGYLDASDRRKMREVKVQHPMLDIRFVFQRAKTKLNKKSKTTYAMWAEKHGFPWCEASDVATLRRWSKEVPNDSLKELL